MSDPTRGTRSLLEALRGVMCQLAEPKAVLRTILEQAVAETGAQRGLFVEVAEAGELTYQVLHGFTPGHLDGDAGGFSRHLFNRVLASGEGVVLGSVLDDPLYARLESTRALQVSSVLCVPIGARGRISALIHLEHRQPSFFRQQHLDLVRSLAEIADPVLETMRAGRDTLRERDQLRLSESRYRGEAEESRRLLASEWSFGRFVGRSPAVRDLEAAVHKAAATSFPVLIEGETGTGKSILARILHYSGSRAAGPLVTVFCPSLEKGLVESELFGHRRGAFTGAVADRLGKVQAAEGGTLFLDEIGELSLEIQPKLLRLLQEKTYERVGDPEERRADVRVVAATNQDLDAAVEEGRFRQDLHARLNFLPLRVPPLRERLEDVGLLLRHCLDQTEAGRWVEVSPEACRFLERLDFSWPGNVRHLEQLAARLAAEGMQGPVSPADLARLLDARESRPGAADPEDVGRADLEAGLPRLLEASERRWLEEALRRYPRFTRAELAARLKISESLLYKKLRQHGLTPER